MKYLLICLLSLLAVPAAAQVSTSKTVSITVTAPSGGVCSAPPPAEAVAAALTTPVLCSDWTTQMPANWLGGCAVAGNGAQTNPNDNTGHVWYNNIWWSNTNQPCSSVQRADPTFGGLVLDMPWTANSANQQVGMTLQTAAWFSTDTTNANQGISVPNNFYMEAVLRQTPIAQGSFAAFWTWPLLAMTDGSGQAGLELDSIELDSGNLNNSDSAYHNWLLDPPGFWIWQGICGHGATAGGLPCNFDPTIYHKFSSLMTSDGTNNTACSYIDDVLINCQPSPGGFAPVQQVARYFILLQNACDWWNYGSNFCNTGLNQHMYVQSVKLWSCPTWQTTQCNKSGISGPNGTNQFSSTWVNSAGTQAITTAPDGVTPALKITQDTSVGGNHGVIQTGAFPTTAPSTFGLNIAPGAATGANKMQMSVCEGPTVNTCTDFVAAFFNPTTGQLVQTNTGNANDHFLGSGSTPLPGSCSPNCGFHVWFTYSMPAASQVIALIAAGPQQNGDGVSSDTVWNWAIETGANAPTDGIGPGFFVSTIGSDSNPGTQASPFLTIGKCQTAMRASAPKTCYIRAGTYNVTSSGGGCIADLNKLPGGPAIAMTTSDNGETWSYYPPDGYNTAIINGGGTLGCAFYIDSATNITINGLQIQNFRSNGVGVVDGGPGILITNNIIHDITEPSTGSVTQPPATGDVYLAAIQFECFGSSSHWGGYTISHNYIYNVGQMATRVDDSNSANPPCTPQNGEQIIISNNYVRNVCATNGDCGAFYIESTQAPSSSPILIQNNYARDVDPNHVLDPVTGTSYVANMIYQDGFINNETITGNVMVSPGVYACWHSDGSANSVAHGNICDTTIGGGNEHAIVDYTKGTSPNITDSQTGNAFSNNLVLRNTASTPNFGYAGDGPPLSPMTVTNNGYTNFGGGGVYFQCGGGACTPNSSQDAVPTTVADPKISCWNVTIDPTSSIFNSPISFPALPSGWGTAGFWGPPGFTIPHTGTAPSWPHAC